MEYRNLGSSGLQVSALSLGSWVTLGERIDTDVAYDCRTAAYEAGVDFFDNAEGYARGNSESVRNVGITTKMGMLQRLEKAKGSHVEADHAHLNTLGLNHLTWHRVLTIDGEEMWPTIFPNYVESLKQEVKPEWDTQTIESLHMIPNHYLQYFYYTDKKLEEQKKWPPSRAQQVMEIEQDLVRPHADPGLTAPPADLMKRGGAYYSTLATQLINSHFDDLGEVHVANTRNDGAVRDLPADWVLELPATMDKACVHPLAADPLPAACFGLIAQVKMYELLTGEAAVHGDRNAAYQALLAHPLGPTADKVQEVLDDMLESNKQWLPQFKS